MLLTLFATRQILLVHRLWSSRMLLWGLNTWCDCSVPQGPFQL